MAYDRVPALARRWKMDQSERVNSASKSTVSTMFFSLGRRTALLKRVIAPEFESLIL